MPSGSGSAPSAQMLYRENSAAIRGWFRSGPIMAVCLIDPAVEVHYDPTASTSLALLRSLARDMQRIVGRTIVRAKRGSQCLLFSGARCHHDARTAHRALRRPQWVNAAHHVAIGN